MTLSLGEEMIDFWQRVIILPCRPNKDDGKKNEERTGVKKKGEYYRSNIETQLVWIALNSRTFI